MASNRSGSGRFEVLGLIGSSVKGIKGQCQPEFGRIRTLKRCGFKHSSQRYVFRQLISMKFTLVGKIGQVETFAAEGRIREIARLRRIYGIGKWRKRKGVAEVRFEDGTTRLAELHWYEANGLGRKEYKIKRFLD